MSEQLGFDWLETARQQRRQGTQGLRADTPRSRRDDPETSHMAADRIRRSGVLKGHQEKVLEAIKRHPGTTYIEIARYSGLERHAVARRLKELEPVHVRRGEPRVIGSRPLTTWWPV